MTEAQRNSSPEVRQKTREIIALQLGLQATDIQDHQNLEALGVDSLSLVEAIFSIEEVFDIRVPFNTGDPREEEAYASDVATFLDAIEALVAEQNPAS